VIVPAESPFAPEEVAGVLAPLDEATMLPARAFLDPEVFAYEQAAWFERDWLCVGRASDVPAAGDWLVAPQSRGPGVLVARGEDGVVRAFHNLCTHRGVRLQAECAGAAASSFRCPYHGWSFHLDGRLAKAPAVGAAGAVGPGSLPRFDAASRALRPVRLEESGGFLFASLAEEGPSLAAWLDDLPAQLEGIPLPDLVRGHRARYEVRANWKLLMENFAESYHFAQVHPQLERLTPSRAAESLVSRGPWQGGWMPFAPGARTVSLDGRRHGRPLLRQSGPAIRGVLDYLLWPNLFLSLQPDYLLTYRLEPAAHDRTHVVFDVLFHPSFATDPDFVSADVIEFWETTNRQDFVVCERQQMGIGSPAYVPGPYTAEEEGMHEFDKIAAERYADP
jgi:Rieske 2Fe-2S family protein